MSADALVLKALAAKTRTELKYFEYAKVQLTYSGTTGIYSTVRDFFVCIGKHALFIVRSNLSNLVKGGCLEYCFLEKVCEDSKNVMALQLVFGGGISSESPRHILLASEQRATLVARLSACYLADAMCREMQIVNFPIQSERLRLPKEFPQPVRVEPFHGFEKKIYQDYMFFLPKCFEDVANATSKTKTGNYKAPLHYFTLNREIEHDDITLEVSVHVYDPVPLVDLAKIGREHIRWVASEYRQALVHNQQTWVLRNQLYLKKMNLSNDPASWVCWEMLLKGEKTTTMCVIMRRQYVPPMCDHSQDFAILVKCPTKHVKEGDPRSPDQKVPLEQKLSEEDVRAWGHLLADTFGPANMNMTLYPELIQAKLDALLFDEEGYAWCWSRLKKRPQGEARVDMFAHLFVKGIVRILKDESVLTSPGLYSDITRQTQEAMYKVPGSGAHEDIDPMTVAMRYLRYPADGVDWSVEDESVLGQVNVARANQWHAKVARYLAFCVDGGLLPGKFTLADIVQTLAHAIISEEATSKLLWILDFLLHVRAKDPMEKWMPKPLQVHLSQVAQMDAQFNDKVLQVLLELGYVRQIMAEAGVPRGPSNDKYGQNIPISTAYASLLKHLLSTDSASINVKASICRQIIKEKETDMGPTLCLGLLALMRDGGHFLATYACAALVNLSQAKEVVKNRIMRRGIAQVCMRLLKSKDDDLVLYTLMLLVHLTKLVHHRNTMKAAGLMPLLNEILDQSYEVVFYKRRILVETCSVLGQMCNDEETRKTMCENYTVVDYLLSIFEYRQSGTILISKVMFALKQLCADSQEQKEKVGPKVIQRLLKDISLDPEKLKDKDWAVNAVMLLMLLAIDTKNVKEMTRDKAWDNAYDALYKSELGSMDATRDRIQQINQRVKEVEGMMQNPLRSLVDAPQRS